MRAHQREACHDARLQRWRPAPWPWRGSCARRTSRPSMLRRATQVSGVWCLSKSTRTEASLTMAHLMPRPPHPWSKTVPRPSVRPQRAHHLTLIKWLFGGADHLVGLVPLAGKQDGVAFPHEFQRLGNAPPANDHALMRCTAHARLDGVENALRILGPR